MPILKDKEKDVYQVFLNDRVVGFFQGDTWGKAQREAASHYNTDKEVSERVMWEHFYALWVNPKHYEKYGIEFEESAETQDSPI